MTTSPSQNETEEGSVPHSAIHDNGEQQTEQQEAHSGHVTSGNFLKYKREMTR